MPRQHSPPEAETRSDALRGNFALLKCPRELDDKDWDGSVYAQLMEAQRLRPGFFTPFGADDSS